MIYSSYYRIENKYNSNSIIFECLLIKIICMFRSKKLVLEKLKEKNFSEKGEEKVKNTQI